MFIDGYGGYNRYGEQFASGRFLILMQPEAPAELSPAERVRYTTDAPMRAIVRKVRLTQLGHFMMGRARRGRVKKEVFPASSNMLLKGGG